MVFEVNVEKNPRQKKWQNCHFGKKCKLFAFFCALNISFFLVKNSSGLKKVQNIKHESVLTSFSGQACQCRKNNNIYGYFVIITPVRTLSNYDGNGSFRNFASRPYVCKTVSRNALAKAIKSVIGLH